MRYKPQEDTWVWILMGYQSAKMFASLKCVYNLKNYVWSWLQWKQFLISAVFVFLCNQSHNRQLQTWCSAETVRNEANTSSVTLLEAHRNTLQSLSLFNPSFIQSSTPCCAVSLTSTFTATVRLSGLQILNTASWRCTLELWRWKNVLIFATSWPFLGAITPIFWIFRNCWPVAC